MADDNNTTVETSVANAPTETVSDQGSVETAKASVAPAGGDLNSNVVSKTTADLDQSGEEDLENARSLALRNHAVEHMNDPVSNTGDKTQV